MEFNLFLLLTALFLSLVASTPSPFTSSPLKPSIERRQFLEVNSTLYHDVIHNSLAVHDDATERDAPDVVYFAFTQANIIASGVSPWYENWTKTLANANWAEGLHEWHAFSVAFFHNSDFRCGALHQGPCEGMPSRFELQRMWVRQGRAFIRRVYFVSQMYSVLHENNQLYQNLLKEVHADVLADAPVIIQAATFQQNPTDSQKCEVINTVIQMTITETANLLVPTIGGIIEPFQKEGGKLYGSIVKIGKAVNDAKETMTWNPRMLLDETITLVGGRAGAAASIINQRRTSQTSGASHKHDFITTGFSTQPFCEDFSGDYPDLNGQNTDSFRMALTETSNELLNHTRLVFDDMYKGNFSQRSLTALLMTRLYFTNLTQRLDEAFDSRKDAAVDNILKYAITEAASQDHTYQVCVFHDKPCEVHKKDRKFKHNGYSDSVICPYPKTLPYLMCSLGHVHFHTKGVYTEESPLLNGLKVFQKTTGRKFNIEDIMFDSLENFSNFGNEPAEIPLDEYGLEPVPVSGSHLGVCVLPQGIAEDFTAHRWWGALNNRNIPLYCGDFRGDQTKAFLERIALAPGSVARNEAFQKDGVPRTLMNLDHGPLVWFMGLCHHGYHWPHPRSISQHIGKGAPEECQNVTSWTQDMTYEEATRWLCGDSKEAKQIMESLHGDVLLTGSHPVANVIQSPHHACKWWRKDKNLGAADLKWYKHYPEGEKYLTLPVPERGNSTGEGS